MAENKSSSPIAEISHGPSKFDAFLDKNQKLLVVAAAVAVFGTVGAIVYSGLGNIQVQQAGSKLFNAEGETALLAAINGAPDSTQATGRYLISQEQGKTDKAAAISTLTDLLAKFPTSSVAPDAKLALNLYKLELGDATAKQGLEQIAADAEAGHTAVLARLALADSALKAGETDAAKAEFTKVAETAKFVRLQDAGKRGANISGVKQPTVIIEKEEIPVPPKPTPPAGIAKPVEEEIAPEKKQTSEQPKASEEIPEDKPKVEQPDPAKIPTPAAKTPVKPAETPAP